MFVFFIIYVHCVCTLCVYIYIPVEQLFTTSTMYVVVLHWNRQLRFYTSPKPYTYDYVTTKLLLVKKENKNLQNITTDILILSLIKGFDVVKSMHTMSWSRAVLSY